MTGFGQAEFSVEGASFAVEIRSVNHRYLDLSVRLPRGLAGLEPALRAHVAQRLARGKVELHVRAAGDAPPPETVSVDLAAAERYLAAARELGARSGVAGALDPGALLALPGVARVVERPLPEDALRPAALAAVASALAVLEAMREAEGAALGRELAARLAGVESLVAELAARADEVQQALRERLRKRAEQLRDEIGPVDDTRLAQEIAWAADRVDATEELVRLRSHVEHFRALLRGADARRPVGRRLDFLLQEMAREANTLGAKGSDAPLAHGVVELKAELERAREQVQNVE
jgi:uncharacterized protein (TIGR00255 family)